ncbi:MAG: preprotein translocase subunit SecE [Anaerolineaceae bacterium]|nr:preprotein translocase subunit SecE [Anaerolineaceae bacterium]
MAQKSNKKASRRKKKVNIIVRLWRETIGELRKVSWPTPQAAWRLTKIVVIVMTVMSALLGLADFIFSNLIQLLYT